MGVVALVAIHNRYGHSIGIFAHIGVGGHLQPLARWCHNWRVATHIAVIILHILAENDIAIQLVEHGAHTLILELRVTAKRGVLAVILYKLVLRRVGDGEGVAAIWRDAPHVALAGRCVNVKAVVVVILIEVAVINCLTDGVAAICRLYNEGVVAVLERDNAVAIGVALSDLEVVVVLVGDGHSDIALGSNEVCLATCHARNTAEGALIALDSTLFVLVILLIFGAIILFALLGCLLPVVGVILALFALLGCLLLIICALLILDVVIRRGVVDSNRYLLARKHKECNESGKYQCYIAFHYIDLFRLKE